MNTNRVIDKGDEMNVTLKKAIKDAKVLLAKRDEVNPIQIIILKQGEVLQRQSSGDTRRRIVIQVLKDSESIGYNLQRNH